MMNERENARQCRELAAGIREARDHYADLGRQIIEQGERVDQSRFQMIEIETELANLDRAQAPTTAVARIGSVAASVAAALAPGGGEGTVARQIGQCQRRFPNGGAEIGTAAQNTNGNRSTTATRFKPIRQQQLQDLRRPSLAC